MKKGLLVLLVVSAIIIGIISCNGNDRVKDKRIVGTWQGYIISTGTTFQHVFKENGTVQLYSEDYVRDYTADDGVLTISQGKYGSDYHEYKFILGVTESGETVEYLVLDGDQQLRRISK